jgi:N-terminal half of MaoC dehydratase
MRALVGREFGTELSSVPIALSDIRKWALAVYYPDVPPRLFWDEEYARSTRHGGIVAPEDFNPFAWFTADGPALAPNYVGPVRNSGPEAAVGIAPPQSTFMLNGGIDVTYGARMRPGDVITAGRTRVVDYKERPSRHGLMLLTWTGSTWTNQNGEMVKNTLRTSIRY